MYAKCALLPDPTFIYRIAQNTTNWVVQLSHIKWWQIGLRLVINIITPYEKGNTPDTSCGYQIYTTWN